MADKSISKKEYELLCNECDKILLSCINSHSVLAVKFLHILRASNIELNEYQFLFDNSPLSNIFTIFKAIVRNAIFVAYSLITSIFHKKNKIERHVNGVDFLFISHYTDQTNSKYYFDSYFGRVASQLVGDKNSVIVAYINHTKHKKKSLNDINFYSVFLDNMVGFRCMMSIYKGIMRSFNCIKKDKSVALSSSTTLNVRVNLFSPSTIKNLIIAKQVGNLVKKLSPRCVITTYEGHAWERLVFHMSKNIDKNIKCIAYQHAPIFKYQHAVKRSVGGNYDPDIILTSGPTSKRQLEESGKLNNSRIVVFGSSRYIDSSINKNKNKNKSTCLVAPEGDIRECLILFKFALTYALNNKNITFIFRFPPMVSMNSLSKLDGEFLNIPNNISISKRSLLDDMLISNSVLYRGSSVVVNCVSFGLRPIYLKLKGELTIDPLYEVTYGRWIVSSHEEFTSALLEKEIDSENSELEKYCKDMYTPLNYKVLKNIALEL